MARSVFSIDFTNSSTHADHTELEIRTLVSNEWVEMYIYLEFLSQLFEIAVRDHATESHFGPNTIFLIRQQRL